MIAGLKPYPVMKDSGLEWLREVPEHWDVKRGKTIFRCIDIRSKTGEEELLTVSSNRGVVPRRSASVTMFKAESYVGYKLCWPDDLVINSLWAWAGGLGVSDHHGIISTAYSVYRPGESVNPRFVNEFVRSRPFHWELQVRSKGIWTSRLQLTDDAFLCAPFVIPPIQEQSAIVRYLDYVGRRVRRLVRAKRKLIALLNEQKQAIIHRAVTRGLDPDVPLKDSGVEWLGEVPAHWDVVALRRRWAVTDCKHLTVHFVEEEGSIPLASVREVQSFELSLATAKRTTYENYSSLIEGGRKPVAGDLIYCRNVSVGAAAIVTTKERFAMGQDVCLIRSARENQRFLNYYLHSPAMDRQLSLLLVGSTFNRINVADIKSLLVAVPPRSEQDEIAAFLDGALVEIEEARGIAKKEIDLLTEYRTRLTADVVTGKLDVREAAAALPEIDPLAVDDEPDTPDAESEADLDDLDAVEEEAP